MADYITRPQGKRNRIYLTGCNLTRPAITDEYLILSTTDLPDLSEGEYILLELMANAHRHGDVLDLKSAVEYLRAWNPRQQGALRDAVTGLIGKDLIDYSAATGLQLLKSLKLKRPRKTQTVFARWNGKGAVHTRALRARMG